MSNAKHWRVGKKLGRTIYRDEICIGMVDNPVIAEQIVQAMNNENDMHIRSLRGEVIYNALQAAAPGSSIVSAEKMAEYEGTIKRAEEAEERVVQAYDDTGELWANRFDRERKRAEEAEAKVADHPNPYERARNLDLLGHNKDLQRDLATATEALEQWQRSCHPHPREHPTMWAAHVNGEKVLAYISATPRGEDAVAAFDKWNDAVGRPWSGVKDVEGELRAGRQDTPVSSGAAFASAGTLRQIAVYIRRDADAPNYANMLDMIADDLAQSYASLTEVRKVVAEMRAWRFGDHGNPDSGDVYAWANHLAAVMGGKT